MRVEVDMFGVLEAGEPRQWWATVFVERGPFMPRWVGSTATYTTQWEAWAEAKRILRADVALEEMDEVLNKV